MQLYKDLFEGRSVEFDLKSGGNSVFKTGKDHNISTVAKMRPQSTFSLDRRNVRGRLRGSARKI